MGSLRRLSSASAGHTEVSSDQVSGDVVHSGATGRKIVKMNAQMEQRDLQNRPGSFRAFSTASTPPRATLDQIRTMFGTRHPCLVTVLGAVAHPRSEPFLVVLLACAVVQTAADTVSMHFFVGDGADVSRIPSRFAAQQDIGAAAADLVLPRHTVNKTVLNS